MPAGLRGPPPPAALSLWHVSDSVRYRSARSACARAAALRAVRNRGALFPSPARHVPVRERVHRDGSVLHATAPRSSAGSMKRAAIRGGDQRSSRHTDSNCSRLLERPTHETSGVKGSPTAAHGADEGKQACCRSQHQPGRLIRNRRRLSTRGCRPASNPRDGNLRSKCTSGPVRGARWMSTSSAFTSMLLRKSSLLVRNSPGSAKKYISPVPPKRLHDPPSR